MQFGITAGFGDSLPLDLLRELQSMGWDVIRQDVQYLSNYKALTRVEEIQAAALIPLILCTARQLEFLPEHIDVEVLDDKDPNPLGLEPHFRMSPQQYVRPVNAAVAPARDRGQRMWVGMTSLERDALAWLRGVCKELDPYCGISVHRYPPSNATRWDATPGFLGRFRRSREQEMREFKDIIGGRPFIVSECGWHQAPIRKWWDRLLFRHRHLTGEQIRDFLMQEQAYWHRHGARMMVVYQLNDAVGRCPKHPIYPAEWRGGFGIRRSPEGPDVGWKPYAFVRD